MFGFAVVVVSGVEGREGIVRGNKFFVGSLIGSVVLIILL